MRTLENDYLKVGIIDHGAEIRTIFNKKNDTEYMWQADPNFWAKTAPVLFPIVGGLKDDTYFLDGKAYNLPRHGLARDYAFTANQISDTQIEYSLSSNDETLKAYPYNFEFKIIYSLLDSKLDVKFVVINENNEDMYFSVGAHPAFNCPLDSNLAFDDYYLEFDKEENNTLLLLEDDLVTKEYNLDLRDNKIIDLNHPLFDDDALAFPNPKSNSVTLKSDKDDKSVVLNYEGFEYIAFWTKDEPHAPFVCLEPWYGIDDYATTNGNLKQKKGIKTVKSNTSFDCNYSIEIK